MSDPDVPQSATICNYLGQKFVCYILGPILARFTLCSPQRNLSCLRPICLNPVKAKTMPEQFLMQTDGVMGLGPVLMREKKSWHPPGLYSLDPHSLWTYSLPWRGRARWEIQSSARQPSAQIRSLLLVRRENLRESTSRNHLPSRRKGSQMLVCAS